MPTYSYACTECDNRFDVVQAFTDDALTTCDGCSGPLRKIFSSVGVVFKGSGFYRTDNRDPRKASTNGHSKPDTSTGSGDKSGSAEQTASGNSPATSSNGDSSASSKATAAASTSG